MDGRWGASLEINSPPDLHPRYRREAPLLLFDLWEDPNCLRSLHAERPDLVAHYAAQLQTLWEAHRMLAEHYTAAEGSSLTPDQLEALDALGYVGD
jgi:hypothetical protein